MAVEVAYDIRRQIAVMWDNTTGQAFGPVFDGPGCDQDANDFLDWLSRNADSHKPYRKTFGGDGTDARAYTAYGLDRAVERWKAAADKYGSVEA